MSARSVKWALLAGCALALFLAPVPAIAQDVPHTVTYWCVDLNDLWNVRVPVIAPRGWIDPATPPPDDLGCRTTFPVSVPSGASIAPGNAFWYTNKTYPPAVRAALEEMGYPFHSQSPAEDFMSKLGAIRVEVWDYPATANLATFWFNPRQNFRLRRLQELNGETVTPPLVNEALGIDLSSEEAGRLPMLGFPVIAGPLALPPGTYVMLLYMLMTDVHNDGLGLDEGNFLPAGETWYLGTRFVVQ